MDAKLYRTYNVVIALMVTGVIICSYLAHTTEGVEPDRAGIVLLGYRLPDTCVYRRLFGMPCLGCGLARAMVSLLDGRVDKASMTHPSAVWVTVWMAAQVVTRVVFILAARKVRLTWPVDLCVSLATMVAAIYLPILCATRIPAVGAAGY